MTKAVLKLTAGLLEVAKILGVMLIVELIVILAVEPPKDMVGSFLAQVLLPETYLRLIHTLGYALVCTVAFSPIASAFMIWSIVRIIRAKNSNVAEGAKAKSSAWLRALRHPLFPLALGAVVEATIRLIAIWVPHALETGSIFAAFAGVVILGYYSIRNLWTPKAASQASLS